LKSAFDAFLGAAFPGFGHSSVSRFDFIFNVSFFKYFKEAERNRALSLFFAVKTGKNAKKRRSTRENRAKSPFALLSPPSTNFSTLSLYY